MKTIINFQDYVEDLKEDIKLHLLHLPKHYKTIEKLKLYQNIRQAWYGEKPFGK